MLNPRSLSSVPLGRVSVDCGVADCFRSGLLGPPFRPPLLLRHTDGPARCGGDDALGTRHGRTHDSQAGEIAQESLALGFNFIQAGLGTSASESEKIGAGHRSSIQPGIEPPPIRLLNDLV